MILFRFQVESTEIVCSDCGKKYKSRGGYQRHRATKHNADQNAHHLTLTPSILAEIVNNALKNISEREVFAADLRNELKQYEYEEPGGETQEFTVIKKLFEDYFKTGNAEKFYGNYYAQVPLKSTIFFKGLSRNAATLLATKVADFILSFCKGIKSSDKNPPSVQTMLSEKEQAGLQYVGGYVLHNLHKKYARKNTTESQQAMAILRAGKLEHGYENQKLVSSLNRGGLWNITKYAQSIFLKTECHFRQLTSVNSLQKVDIAGIVHNTITDSAILSSYQCMVSDAELIPNVEVSNNVFHAIVCLYIRVRSFSCAKDIIQRYKINAKQSKGKALRKEIMRSHEQETVRQD